ncbi:MAG: hypothetical protein HC893_17060 [Chloroflexaceae bacterium]|nr:hypothetical protein [Chloroflexaceae bacterium]
MTKNVLLPIIGSHVGGIEFNEGHGGIVDHLDMPIVLIGRRGNRHGAQRGDADADAHRSGDPNNQNDQDEYSGTSFVFPGFRMAFETALLPWLCGSKVILDIHDPMPEVYDLEVC